MIAMTDDNKYPYTMRGAIVRTAKYLFDMKGYDNTSLDEVCEHLQIQEKVFYLFFRSKDDLLEAVWSEQ